MLGPQEKYISPPVYPSFRCANCAFVTASLNTLQCHSISCQPGESLSGKSASAVNSLDKFSPNFIRNIPHSIDVRATADSSPADVLTIKTLSIPAENFDMKEDLFGETIDTKLSAANHIQCSLCLEIFTAADSFETHLVGEHCINKNNLSRLSILLRAPKQTAPDFLNANCNKLPPKKSAEKSIRKKDCRTTKIRRRLSNWIYCYQCGSSFKQEKQLLFHAQQMQHFMCQDGEIVCLSFGSPTNTCSARFPTLSDMLEHYNEVHVNVIVSEKHAYKYRCSLCSLAFTSREKLETHSLYHLIRDATKCSICLQNFKSTKALNNHIDQIHRNVLNTTKLSDSKVMTDHADREHLQDESPKNDKISDNDLTSTPLLSSDSSLYESSCSPLSERFDSLPLTKKSAPKIFKVDMGSSKSGLGEQLQHSETSSISKALMVNPADIIKIIQLNQLMSLNLAPPLVLEEAISKDLQERQTNLLLEDKDMDTQLFDKLSPINTFARMESRSQTEKQLTRNAISVDSNNQALCSTKRARTRITDEQLKILRSHFDINNSPSEGSIVDMSQKSNLPIKVVKHWFRNTLFKERQKNKDSPYNFNNPPLTTFDLEIYENADTSKSNSGSDMVKDNKLELDDKQGLLDVNKKKMDLNLLIPVGTNFSTKPANDFINRNKVRNKKEDTDNYNNHFEQIMGCTDIIAENNTFASVKENKFDQNYSEPQEEKEKCDKSDLDSGSNPISKLPVNLNDFYNQQLESLVCSQMGPPKKYQPASTIVSDRLQAPNSNAGSLTTVNKYFGKQSRISQSDNCCSNINSGSNSAGKRANRTRFTDYQIKVLQEFFENNSYPKDSDLEYLSKLLLLSPRVIVVWFQNARQKQRKIYENQPNNVLVESEEKKPNISYACKRCNQTFQRYYELIRHQKNHCFKEECNKKSAKAQMAASQISQNNSSEDSSSSVDVFNSPTSFSTQFYSLIGNNAVNTCEGTPPHHQNSSAVSGNDYDGCNDFLRSFYKRYYSVNFKCKSRVTIHRAHFLNTNLDIIMTNKKIFTFGKSLSTLLVKLIKASLITENFICIRREMPFYRKHLKKRQGHSIQKLILTLYFSHNVTTSMEPNARLLVYFHSRMVCILSLNTYKIIFHNLRTNRLPRLKAVKFLVNNGNAIAKNPTSKKLYTHKRSGNRLSMIFRSKKCLLSLNRLSFECNSCYICVSDNQCFIYGKLLKKISSIVNTYRPHLNCDSLNAAMA